MKQKYGKSLPGILLMLAMVLGLSFGMDTAALADAIINDVQYIYYKDQQAAIKGKTSSGKQNCRKVEQGNDTWDSGWYVVSDNVSIDRHITVNGDVHLILMDGKQLNVRSIRDGSDSKLTIYAQSTGNDMGKLIINP